MLTTALLTTALLTMAYRADPSDMSPMSCVRCSFVTAAQFSAWSCSVLGVGVGSVAERGMVEVRVRVRVRVGVRVSFRIRVRKYSGPAA